jgi:hemerythrin-like domain-containing protein
MIHEKTSYEKVIDEHRELRQMMRELRQFLDGLQPQTATEDAHIWAGDLAERLVKLHRKLFLHFREEDRSGILEELADRFPWAEQTIQMLHAEHDQILSEVRAIVAATMVCVEDKLSSDCDLRDRTLRLFDQMTQHEAAETDLIQRLLWEDLGGGD